MSQITSVIGTIVNIAAVFFCCFIIWFVLKMSLKSLGEYDNLVNFFKRKLSKKGGEQDSTKKGKEVKKEEISKKESIKKKELKGDDQKVIPAQIS